MKCSESRKVKTSNPNHWLINDINKNLYCDLCLVIGIIILYSVFREVCHIINSRRVTFKLFDLCIDFDDSEAEPPKKWRVFTLRGNRVIGPGKSLFFPIK